MKRKEKRYKAVYPQKMHTFFVTYDDTCGAPSFSKFARSIGVTPSDIEDFRAHEEFDRAYRACNEIRRDYLIDHALNRRFDPSFVKFLLTTEFSMQEEAGTDTLAVTLEVLS